MGSFFYRMLDWCRWLFGVVPKSAIGSPKSYLFVHYIFIAVITLLLAIFSDSIVNSLHFTPPKFEIRWISDIWCGVLFLLLYGIVRTVLFLIGLLGIEEESDFPDIEADWKEILTALERERLYIDELPLFLVNGMTPQQERSAFETSSDNGAGSEWKVIAPPLDRNSTVLRAYARENGIFLCMSGVGVTTCQQGKVVADSDSSISRSGASEKLTGTMKAGQMPEKPRPLTGTVTGMPAPSAAPVLAMTQGGSAPAPRSFMGTMVPGGMKKAMQTFSATNFSGLKGYGKKKVQPVTDLESLVGIRRVRFLCQLINAVRKPFCGLNGMLQAIPLSWASDPDYARKLAPAVRDDLVAVHSVLHLQFPVIAMFTELDDLSGMREFLLRTERICPGLRKTRAGSSFPKGVEMTESMAQWITDSGLQWFRRWVYAGFANDLDHRENPKMFQMVCELGQRRDGIMVLLRECLYAGIKPALRLHGVYFAATGRLATEQGFIEGVVDKLRQDQNEVAWAPHYVRSVQRSRSFAILLFVAASAATVATIFILYTMKNK